MSAIDRLCDACQTPLVIHGDTLAGQACDLHLAMSDLWRSLLIGMMGERRGWRIWWLTYDRDRAHNLPTTF
jgi:hypothetical protein